MNDRASEITPSLSFVETERPESGPLPSMRLLVDGRQAFPELISLFRGARESIDINMFIWRDDEIGNLIAREALDAAERGVRVRLSVDRYGTVFEHAEESRRSFFHKHLTLFERLQVAVMGRLYFRYLPKSRPRDEESALHQAILSHPNITVDADENRYDHSKFYIFDEATLVLGGINIEDKENGSDMRGFAYGDYMVRLDGPESVAAFREKRRTGKDSPSSHCFGMNLKRLSGNAATLFEMEERYLGLISRANAEITVIMAYFSPLPRFIDAIEAAVTRGVAVRILIPACANVQDASNKACMAKLMRRCAGNAAANKLPLGKTAPLKSGRDADEQRGSLRIFLSPRMLHTKLLLSEKELSFGSTNINKKAFESLDELNLCLERPASLEDARDRTFWTELSTSIEACFEEAREVISSDELDYPWLRARIEGLVV